MGPSSSSPTLAPRSIIALILRRAGGTLPKTHSDLQPTAVLGVEVF